MWLRAVLMSEEHLSCVQHLERRRGFQEVGKVGDRYSLVGEIIVAGTGVWVLVGEGRKIVLALVLVAAKVGVDEEEKEELLGRRQLRHRRRAPPQLLTGQQEEQLKRMERGSRRLLCRPRCRKRLSPFPFPLRMQPGSHRGCRAREV